jgi:TDG/mug DNA glycosylase family protein
MADGHELVTLADLPPLRDRLLFVGLNPSPASVAAGHYHQDEAGRSFWLRLVEALIIPAGTSLAAADDALVARGHGLTDLVKVPGQDAPAANELAAGVGPLWQKIAIWRPAAVVFVDRRAAEATATGPVSIRWGRLPGVALAGRPCLLLPGTDLDPAEVRAGVAFFRDLAGIIEGLLPSDGGGPLAN